MMHATPFANNGGGNVSLREDCVELLNDQRRPVSEESMLPDLIIVRWMKMIA